MNRNTNGHLLKCKILYQLFGVSSLGGVLVSNKGGKISHLLAFCREELLRGNVLLLTGTRGPWAVGSVGPIFTDSIFCVKNLGGGFSRGFSRREEEVMLERGKEVSTLD